VIKMLFSFKNHEGRARLWVGAGLAALIAVLVASCGGGSGTDNTVSSAGTDALQLGQITVADVAGDTAGEAAKSDSDDGDDKKCSKRNNNTFKKLLKCVTLDGVRGQQAALQAIADANNGIRTSGTPGYDASADYAEEVFRDAGYKVTRQAFQFQTFIELIPTKLAQVSPPPAGPIETRVMTYSGSGSVTASVSVPSGDFRGCRASDFAGFTAGNIALVSRGRPADLPPEIACTFALKATNAQAAGASAVVIYNNVPGPLNGTLGATFALDVAVTAVTQTVGQQLSAIADLVLAINASTFRGTATTSNILAESVKGDPENVVMVGAHLDSVNAGPGIQDNGSGSAAILELAVQMAKVKPENKVRFALWGAEESGLIGSTYYVNNLTPEDKAKIKLYLNFDMIGSPNPVYFIYDGDNSDNVGSGPGPEGSAAIEKVFENFYTLRGLPFKGTDFDGRSDYGPFITAGIPAGGLFTGAEGIKTAEEAALWGGTAGEAYDKCYHQACDNFDNINLTALDVNSDAVAYATLYFAMRKGGPLPAPAPTATARSGAATAVPPWREYEPHEEQ
jgi:Zn-dependent M28 family amino/carboxypeptidase